MNKKLLKFTLIFIALCILTITISPILLDKTKLISSITNKLKNDLDLDVDFGEELKLTFFPFPGLKIKDFDFKDDANGISIISAERLKLIEKNKDFALDEWYMAMSNHQSWADIFVLLVAANYKIPLLKFFMKKELWWIPFVFLANKTLNMPFVNRHSKEDLEKDPSLITQDYENTLKS